MTALAQALIDRYRCPEGCVELQLAGRLSEDAGFFRFGPRTICYGQSSSGFRKRGVQAGLYDTFNDVGISGSKLHLPFNPTDIIENLRRERYVGAYRTAQRVRQLARRGYYFLRPLLRTRLRRGIQKAHLQGWKKLAFPTWPVDTSVENICEKVLSLSLKAQGCDSIPFIWFWPNGATACVLMTHDVETAKGRDFCSSLMDIDDSYGIRSSFQVVPEERYAVSPQFLASIRDRGFELNIQDLNHDGLLFSNRDEFQRRAKKINRYLAEYGSAGFRAAVLYREPDWYDALECSFDMSIPTVAHLDPQRGGCCTVMPFFIGSIAELPLTTTQDYMLLHLLEQDTVNLWRTQTELILKKNGLVSFLVHPDYVSEQDGTRMYRELLEYLRHLRSVMPIWFALPGEIDRWWRARSRMRVVKENSEWCIKGEDSERAVLAFAKSVDNELVYELDRKGSTHFA